MGGFERRSLSLYLPTEKIIKIMKKSVTVREQNWRHERLHGFDICHN